MKDLSHNCGFSTVETLLAVALTSLSAALLLPLIKTALVSHIALRQRHMALLAEERLQTLVATIADDIDSHHLNLLPDIQPATSELQPRSDSRNDSITSIRLAPQSILQAYPVEYLSDNRTTFLACKRFPKERLRITNHGFVGVSTDGFTYLTGRPQANRKQKNGCVILQLTKRSNRIAGNSPDIDPDYIRLLIPVITHYTLVLDGEGTLRYYSHPGPHRENQPVLSGLRQLRFRKTLSDSSRHVTIRAQAQTTSGYTISALKTCVIPRSPHYSLLLNQT